MQARSPSPGPDKRPMEMRPQEQQASADDMVNDI